MKVGIYLPVGCFLMPNRHLCLIYVRLTLGVYHVVLNVSLICVYFTLHLDSKLPWLEHCLETIQKLKASLCLLGSTLLGVPAKLPPSFYMDSW